MADKAKMAEQIKEEGNGYFRSGLYEKAAEAFTRAIAVDPTNHVLFSNRSGAYHGLNQMQRALEDADRCIALNSSWAKGHVRRGAALQGLHRLDDALRAYLIAYGFNPAHPEYVAKKLQIDAERMRGVADQSASVVNAHKAAQLAAQKAAAAAPPPIPELSGYLMKPRASGVGQSRRWFVLDGTQLKWYANKKVLNESRRMVELMGTEIFGVTGTEFRLRGPTLHRTITLRAESVEERDRWVNGIRHAVAWANAHPAEAKPEVQMPLRSPLDQWVEPDPIDA